MSSRLFTEVRERRGLAYYVFGLNHSYTDAGSLYAQAGVDINRIDEAVTTILGELRTIAADAVPADELEKARNFAKGRFVLQLESPQGLILFGLRREVLERHAPDLDEVLDGLNAVTAEDVQRVAQDLIADEQLRLAVIGPVRRRRAVREAARLDANRAGRPCGRPALHISKGTRPFVRSGRRSGQHLGPGAARQSAFNPTAVVSRFRSNHSTRTAPNLLRFGGSSRSRPRCTARSSSSAICAVAARPSSAKRRVSSTSPATMCARASAS